MIDRAREIAKMMGYDSMSEVWEGIGSGTLVLMKIPEQRQLQAAEWLIDHVPEVRAEDEELADVLEEIAQGLEFAMELRRYPADTDICEMDLPHGWPSYCEKGALE
jgi:hypothetical protein